MNFLEVNKVLNKMINNTRVGAIDLNVSIIKNGLIIDKKD